MLLFLWFCFCIHYKYICIWTISNPHFISIQNKSLILSQNTYFHSSLHLFSLKLRQILHLVHSQPKHQPNLPNTVLEDISTSITQYHVFLSIPHSKQCVQNNSNQFLLKLCLFPPESYNEINNLSLIPHTTQALSPPINPYLQISSTNDLEIDYQHQLYQLMEQFIPKQIQLHDF